MMEKLFIVGVGRSGTSMLQVMFNAHPEISFLPETSFLRKYVLNNKNRDFKSRKDKIHFIEVLEQDEKFKRLHIVDAASLVNKSNNHLEVYNNILREYKNIVVGDKDPRLLDYLPELNKRFPKATVVHIIRDPRDVVLSRTKADWSKHWPFSLHSYLYSTQMARGRKQGQKFFGENYIEIKYEELVQNPERELSRLCKVLNLNFDKGMLAFGATAKDLVDESEMQWKKEVLGPLLKDNYNKWKNEFTPKEIDLIQKICRNSFGNDGYQLSEEALGDSFSNRLHVVGSRIFKVLYPIRLKLWK